MSQRRASNKRKGSSENIAMDDDEEEERKEDKRSRLEPATAASASSSAAAASASSSSVASSPASGAASSPAGASSGVVETVEELLCSVCLEPFECADGAARLPRLLPCGRHQLCSSCIVASIKVNPGSVLCPKGHGLLPISAAGVAAAALSTADDWMRLLPPFADFIAAIRNQQLMMTQLAQKGAECSHQGCKAPVTHFCSDCGDLCSTHEGKRHSIDLLQTHKTKTVPIANKAVFLQQHQQSKLAGPAAKIRSQATALLLQQQQLTAAAEHELKQLESQTQLQLQKARQEVEAKLKALSALKQTTDAMQKADDSTVLEMEADRLAADGLAAAYARPMADSAILSKLDGKLVADLQTLLGSNRSLSNATLIYRASRDGFKAADWWRLCGGKSNLLTIVRVKGNEFVCGAFTPFQWPVRMPVKSAMDIPDPTGTTFLFSLVNAHNRAVKLRLKESEKKSAGSVWVGCGPQFGEDLALMRGYNSANMPTGIVASPFSFEFDSVVDGGPSIICDKMLLAGDDGNGYRCVHFDAAEIEGWQL